jgi:peptidoglycan L-alanyl-D-glutamate endopeptidase CwlK
MFPVTPVGNISLNLPLVLNAMKQARIADRTMILLALAIISAECESFTPCTEQQSMYNTSSGGKPFDLYDNQATLGNQGGQDGEKYRGRGYVFLTGRINYLRMSQALGIDLVADPRKASDPAIAAKILAQFLQAQQGGLRVAIANGDLAKARRTINGGSNGLGRFASTYIIGDKLIKK